MSTGASLNALQRLVEQLKREARVERIKVSQAVAELQQYCMQMPCWSASQLEATPSGSPDPVLYSEDSMEDVP